MLKLMTPGPVQVPREVLEAQLAAPPYHRSAEFRELMASLREDLLALSRGAHEVALLAGSGTTAVDAMVWSLLRPGDRVLAVVNGEFSERMAASAAARGAVVDVIRAEPGGAPDPAEVVGAVRRGGYKAVILVRSETSTGVLYPVKGLAEELSAMGVELLVDDVSGFVGNEINMDWGVTALATCSHKALAAPPGVGIVLLSEGAARALRARPPGVPSSIDLSLYIEFSSRLETPFTPPLTVLSALRAALHRVKRVGLENFIEAHRSRSLLLYELLTKVGFEPLPASASLRSNTVAALRSPVGSGPVIEAARRRGYLISPGMGALRDEVVRVGTMGDITEDDVRSLAAAIREVLEGAGGGIRTHAPFRVTGLEPVALDRSATPAPP